MHLSTLRVSVYVRVCLEIIGVVTTDEPLHSLDLNQIGHL